RFFTPFHFVGSNMRFREVAGIRFGFPSCREAAMNAPTSTIAFDSAWCGISNAPESAMRLSRYFMPILKENPKEAEI
ncbi:hypothetical protein ACC775_38660, partial [Rhizobium ruizarguesonis]